MKGADPLVPADAAGRVCFYGRPDRKAVAWMRPQKPPEEVPDAEYPLWYTTGRVIEQWHTGTMTRNCAELRQANFESVAQIHPDDALGTAGLPQEAPAVGGRRAARGRPRRRRAASLHGSGGGRVAHVGHSENAEAGTRPARWDGMARGGGQMRIGITTYLKPTCSGTVISALELPSESSTFTISWLMLASASIR